MEILETRIIPDRIGGKESPLVTVEFNARAENPSR